MEEIHVGVIYVGDVDTVSVLSSIFALRTHVPEEDQVDFKYIISSRNDVMYLCTHDISIKFGDLDILQEAIPSGTYATLFDGTKVVVWHLEVDE